MKKIFLLFATAAMVSASFAQQGKKTSRKEKEKEPTQAELQQMLKEAQKELDNMSPEDKKAMEQMGIKMPDIEKMKKDASGVSDAQLKKAYEDETRPVPLRDAARIAAIPSAISNTGVAAYISSTHTKVLTALQSESKNTGEKVYSQLKAMGKNAEAMGKAAVGLWIIGKAEIGLYVMGRACMDNPSSTANTGNYASMLSMIGAEQLAIPLLNNLNARFPRNSTLLNNLGQAWLGLGEIDRAEKYLDSAIRIYAYHPQANHSRSLIEESKGHQPEALRFEKNAIHDAYSQDKEARLRKLGYKLSSADTKLPLKTKPDPLNLGGFSHPPYPKSVDECIALEKVWIEFRQQVKEEGTMLKQRLETAQQNAQKNQEKVINNDLAMIKASINSGRPQGQLTPMPLYASRAAIKIREITDEYQRKLTAFGKKVSDFATGPGAKLTKEYNDEMARLRKEDGDQTGEGRPNRDYCPQYKEASDKYLAAYNSAVEALKNESVEITKNYLNDDTYWKMYAEWPENYEASKLAAKIAWLGEMACESPLVFKSITEFKCKPPAEKKGAKLAAFDDVACKYHSEMDLYVFKIKSDCSRMTTELDAPFVKMGLKQDMDKENFSDQFMNFTAEVSAEVGKEVEVGPVEIGVSARGGMGIEVDRSGVKDVYVIGEAGGGVGPVGGSFEGRISLVSGKSSMVGSGLFQGLK